VLKAWALTLLVNDPGMGSEQFELEMVGFAEDALDRALKDAPLAVLAFVRKEGVYEACLQDALAEIDDGCSALETLLEFREAFNRVMNPLVLPDVIEAAVVLPLSKAAAKALARAEAKAERKAAANEAKAVKAAAAAAAAAVNTGAGAKLAAQLVSRMLAPLPEGAFQLVFELIVARDSVAATMAKKLGPYWEQILLVEDLATTDGYVNATQKAGVEIYAAFKEHLETAMYPESRFEAVLTRIQMLSERFFLNARAIAAWNGVFGKELVLPVDVRGVRGPLVYNEVISAVVAVMTRSESALSWLGVMAEGVDAPAPAPAQAAAAAAAVEPAAAAAAAEPEAMPAWNKGSDAVPTLRIAGALAERLERLFRPGTRAARRLQRYMQEASAKDAEKEEEEEVNVAGQGAEAEAEAKAQFDAEALQVAGEEC
jgi:hypothetical protein